MKVLMKRLLSVLCVVAALSVATLGVEMFFADAASNSITVTSAITGEKKYTGDDLQEAFSAAERGCIVAISRYITLTADVTLSAEVMLTGQSYIKFEDYRILLHGKGALFVDTRLRTKYIAAANAAYSEIEMVEENGGFLYYIVAQAPSFGKAKPTFKESGIVYGNRVDEESGILYHDVVVSGITTGELGSLVSITASNSEKVDVTYNGTVSVNDRTYVTNGSTMVLSASNHDFAEKVTKSYTVILLGDVNGNGMVDAADANLISCHANGTKPLTGNALLAADANQDSFVTWEDAQLLCDKYVRIDSYSSPLA